MRGKKSYLARGRRYLAASLAVLWRRPVAVSWLTDGGSKQRRYSFERRCYGFFKFFYLFAAFPSYILVPIPFGSFSPLFVSFCFLSFFLPFVFLSSRFLSFYGPPLFFFFLPLLLCWVLFIEQVSVAFYCGAWGARAAAVGRPFGCSCRGTASPFFW
jgi:hypothetical protein